MTCPFLKILLKHGHPIPSTQGPGCGYRVEWGAVLDAGSQVIDYCYTLEMTGGAWGQHAVSTPPPGRTLLYTTPSPGGSILSLCTHQAIRK